MITYKKPIVCPHCNSNLDAAMEVNDRSATPSVGDVSICFVCGGICFYGEGDTLIKPTKEQLDKLYREHPELKRISQFTMLYKLKRGNYSDW